MSMIKLFLASLGSVPTADSRWIVTAKWEKGKETGLDLKWITVLEAADAICRPPDELFPLFSGFLSLSLSLFISTFLLLFFFVSIIFIYLFYFCGWDLVVYGNCRLSPLRINFLRLKGNES